MFVSILLQNGVYVRDVEVGVKCLVGYVPGRICYDSEEFLTGNRCITDIFGLAGAAPKCNAVGP